jgi:hypothetical protein
LLQFVVVKFFDFPKTEKAILLKKYGCLFMWDDSNSVDLTLKFIKNGRNPT